MAASTKKVIKRRTINVRMDPTLDQDTDFMKTFGCCRYVWNQMLGDEQEFYAATDCHFVPTPAKYKSEHPFLKEVDSLALANTQINLNKAFSAFFKGNSGHPKFKSKKKTKLSYTTNCQVSKAGVASIELTDDAIKLPKIGWVKIKLHRKPLGFWKLKSVAVTKNNLGVYYCSILFEWEEDAPEMQLPTEKNTIGLDYSSPLFYVDDQGGSPEKERYFHEAEEKLAREQRKLSKMKYGSNNYWDQKKRVDKIYEKIANQRKDFCHKESRKIANSYVAVCVEDINLKAMSQTLRLGKSTMDNGFGMFRRFLEYKLQDQGKHLIVIDRWFPSSKTCNCCGYINQGLELGQSEWICPSCGTEVPRDSNAGKNIKQEGLRQFFAEFAA